MEWNYKILSVIEGTNEHAVTVHFKFMYCYLMPSFNFFIKKVKINGCTYYVFSIGWLKLSFGYKEEWIYIKNRK